MAIKKYLIIILLPLFCGICFMGWSEDNTGEYARIVSQGQGEVSAVPTHVEFQFIRIAKDSSFDLALKGIQDFETKLIHTVRGRGYVVK